MKLGFYDSGLGGISVLKKFVEEYGPGYSYVYYGDSVHAPYGEKTKEELLGYLGGIFSYMEDKEVDLVVSACNTTSMFLSDFDLDDYFFETISLYDVMKKYFAKHDFSSKKVALLATPTNVESGRYKDWGLEIEAIACPKLVPLVESGNMQAAKEEWQNYLSQCSSDTTDLIVGCTHYSFLVDKNSSLDFIDPADIVLEQFKESMFADGLLGYANLEAKLELDLFFSKENENYSVFAQKLLTGEI